MTGDPLTDTQAGTVHAGDRFYFRRTTLFGRDQTGWVTARSALNTPNGVLVTGTDDRSRCRTIRVTDIVRVKRAGATR